MITWLIRISWAEEFGCSTLFHMHDKPFREPLEVTIADGEKVNRDAYNNQFNQLESENFAVKWGDDFLSNGIEEIISSYFEETWTVQINDWGMLQPEGTEEALFNVYIGNSGNRAPEIGEGSGGYFTYDDQGWPMIVLNPEAIQNQDYLPTLIAHEFFHAVQRKTDLYSNAESRWFFEGSAEWAAANMYPSSVHPISAIDSYMNLSELSLNNFLHLYDVETDAEMERARYSYGTVLFLIFLHEYTMDSGFIPAIWNPEIARENPIETMKLLLAEKDLDFYDVWMQHNASIVFMEGYTYGDMYRQRKSYEDWLSDIWTENGIAMTSVTSDIRLKHLGYRIHRLYNMTASRYRFQVWANPIGSHDSIAGFRAILVKRMGSTVMSLPIEMNNWFGEVTIDGFTETDDAYLVVGAWAERENSVFGEEEDFVYSYAMEGLASLDVPDEDDDVENGVIIPDMKVCGCASLEPTSTFALWIVIVLYRRREQE